ncbi:Hypothetical_protein [Hexamita inflata]|uniref:Hypothetical_protein n=1 Tax=Hexamita inflata TaxID=28002 RepID=A0AA86PR04_9EUKA|nr:Hypothetical protein HINF_LOCUS30913 [Hexamita inflata]
MTLLTFKNAVVDTNIECTVKHPEFLKKYKSAPSTIDQQIQTDPEIIPQVKKLSKKEQKQVEVELKKAPKPVQRKGYNPWETEEIISDDLNFLVVEDNLNFQEVEIQALEPEQDTMTSSTNMSNSSNIETKLSEEPVKRKLSAHDKFFLEKFGDAFRIEINQQIGALFNSPADDIKTALIYRKQYLSRGKRLFINVSSLSQEFRITEQQCHQVIQQLQEQYLGDWDPALIQQIKSFVKNCWDLNNSGDLKLKKDQVKEQVIKEFKLNEQFDEDYKKVYNAIQYQLRVLSK